MWKFATRDKLNEGEDPTGQSDCSWQENSKKAQRPVALPNYTTEGPLNKVN
jgi:hypothetical protein